MTSSEVEFIYVTFSSLMLLNSHRTSVPSKPKKRSLLKLIKILADRTEDACRTTDQDCFEHEKTLEKWLKQIRVQLIRRSVKL